MHRADPNVQQARILVTAVGVASVLGSSRQHLAMASLCACQSSLSALASLRQLAHQVGPGMRGSLLLD